ncbi:MAG TPA: hypothetical protein VEH09_13680 [Thermodesulfobacteriota bacterium]|nr:hypothetical protein [Thermodesulfobacteriota bacterium]
MREGLYEEKEKARIITLAFQFLRRQEGGWEHLLRHPKTRIFKSFSKNSHQKNWRRKKMELEYYVNGRFLFGFLGRGCG